MATDRGALSDIPAWADSTGNEMVSQAEEGKDLVFLIRKSDEA
jgi:TusA-related sulfurtransferase